MTRIKLTELIWAGFKIMSKIDKSFYKKRIKKKFIMRERHGNPVWNTKISHEHELDLWKRISDEHHTCHMLKMIYENTLSARLKLQHRRGFKMRRRNH